MKTNKPRLVPMAFLLCAVLLVAAAMLAIALHHLPTATLHEPTDAGYIPTAAELMDFTVSAPQAFVYNATTNEILWMQGEHRVVYPASTTKLMSALYALTVLSPDEIVTVGDEVTLIDPASSRAYITQGQQLSVEMLIEGMMLPSGNDAAYTLAAAAGRRTAGDSLGAAEAIAAFLDGMNAYAVTLGLCGTDFTTPDGLADEQHYTTLEDLMLIAKAALANPTIAKYAAMHEDRVVYHSGEINTWTNTNALLDPDSPYYRENVTGLKTGSLTRNYCLLCSVEQDGATYIIGIFGAKTKAARFADACTIIDALP